MTIAFFLIYGKQLVTSAKFTGQLNLFQNLCIVGCFLLEEITLTYEQLRGYYLVVTAVVGYVLICLASLISMIFNETCLVTWLLFYSVGGMLNIVSSAFLFLHWSKMETMHVKGMNQYCVESIASISLICGCLMLIDTGLICVQLIKELGGEGT